MSDGPTDGRPAWAPGESIPRARARRETDPRAAQGRVRDEGNATGRRSDSSRETPTSGAPAPGASSTDAPPSAEPDGPSRLRFQSPRDDIAPIIGVERRWTSSIVIYPLLAVMAAADAYGFWNTLVEIFGRDSALLIVLVVALGIGAVTGPHVAGQIARSIKDSQGGSWAWVGALVVAWLALGTSIAYIRLSHGSDAGSGGSKSSLLGNQESAVSTSGAGDIGITVLLVSLFLMTGLLAMWHAYRTSDPRGRELRAYLRRRQRLMRQLALDRIAVAEERRRLEQFDALQKFNDDDRDLRHEGLEVHEGILNQEVKMAFARSRPDPRNSDEIFGLNDK
ncbi:hypothetical protein [Cryptosporangium sp. NPDC048952]|uniref:hypothetical protein n=1 Tax=Cryptosporangium sp. NPDC048952 TaxID=3363961 RepID=UPI00371B7D56